MSWESTWTSLVTIVASAPNFGHRRAADVLLAREETAELGQRSIQLNQPFRREFFAYQAMGEIGLRDGESLMEWNARYPAERFGLPPDASFTDKVALIAGNPDSNLGWHVRFRPGHVSISTGGTPHTPQPASTLAEAQAEVEVFAAELVADVIAEMGSPAWSAARAVYE